ncbi:MAG: AsmA-like C-terminal region-containing protein [Flavobacteriales bacterium]|nr:AsmA-like C-terminal region-containing protein [Flavobacteriales bacterium]
MIKLYDKEIKEIALQQINNQLISPMIVQDIELSAFNYFPAISLQFSNLLIKDPLANNDTLLFAKNAFLNFDAYDLINKKYIVRKLVLKNGSLAIKVNSDGKENFNVFVSNDKSENENFKFSLDQLTLKDFSVNYQNIPLSQEYDFTISDSKLKGQFSSQEYDLNILSSMLVNKFDLEGVNYISSKNANTKIILHVKNDPFTLTIKKGKLKIADMNFFLEGDYKSSKKDRINLNIKGNQIQISEIFSILPLDYTSIKTKYSSEGIFNFDGNLNGEMNNKQTLSFIVNFNAEKATLIDKLNNIQLEKIDLSGTFNNKEQNLKIINFSALMNDKIMRGNLEVNNFKKPTYFLNIDGLFDLNKIPFFTTLKDFSLDGETAIEMETKITTKNDKLFFENLDGKIVSEKINIAYMPLKTHLELNGFEADISKKNMNISIQKSFFNEDEFSMNLNLMDWNKWFQSDSKKIKCNYELKLDKFHLDDFLEIFDSKDSSNADYQIDLEGAIAANELYYDNLKFFNLSSKSLKINKSIEIKNLFMESYDGEISLNIYNADLSSDNQNWLIDGKLSSLNIKQLMKSFNDFDQDYIKNEHISGIISSDFNSKLIFDSLNNWDFQNSSIESKNTFKEIELLEYPFLYDVLKVFENSVITRNIIDIDHYEKNLHKVVFKDFKSTIISSDGITEFDKTNFENDVLDFSFYGNYNIENQVDYHLSFNWADIVRKKKSKSDIVQENPVKGKQLFLKISGPVEDLSYGFDKAEIKKERKEIISNEKETIKDIIKGDYQEDEKKSEVFELEKETLEKDTIQELKASQNLKTKKKKDSSKLDKFLKKLGVEEPEKKKPEFEIDQ